MLTKCNRFLSASGALLLAILPACSDGKLYPVYKEVSTDMEQVKPDSETETESEIDTRGPISSDTVSDTVPDTASDTSPVAADSENETDSESNICPYQGCFPISDCHNYGLVPADGICEWPGYICCKRVCSGAGACVQRGSQDCVAGVITPDECEPGKLCCAYWEPPLPRCIFDEIPENQCAADIPTCVAGGGTPHGAQCNNGEVCCFYPQQM